MIVELGRKSQIEKEKVEQLQKFSIDHPAKMPKIPKGHTIVCGLEQDGAEGERIFLCETRKDVQDFWRKNADLHGVQVSWYHTAAFQLQ
jgi:hypothetical protein